MNPTDHRNQQIVKFDRTYVPSYRMNLANSAETPERMVKKKTSQVGHMILSGAFSGGLSESKASPNSPSTPETVAAYEVGSVLKAGFSYARLTLSNGFQYFKEIYNTPSDATTPASLAPQMTREEALTRLNLSEEEAGDRSLVDKRYTRISDALTKRIAKMPSIYFQIELQSMLDSATLAYQTLTKE